MFWREKEKEPIIYAEDIKTLTNKREKLDKDIKSLRDAFTFLCPTETGYFGGVSHHNPALASAINDRIKKLQKVKYALHLPLTRRDVH